MCRTSQSRTAQAATITSLLVVTLSAAGCGDRASGPETTGTDGFRKVLLASPAGCSEQNFAGIHRACVVDAAGNTYDPFDTDATGEMLVVPKDREVGVFYQFLDGNIPPPERIGTQGPSASIRAYAAPWSVEASDSRCCAENEEHNRISATAQLSQDKLLVRLARQVEQPVQVAVILDYPALYALGTKLLPQGYIIGQQHPGFVVRFYVDQTISPSTDAGR